jgi:hypothetical protein
MRKPIEHLDQLTDRVAALEQTMRRLARANTSNSRALADRRAEALLTTLSILIRMLHAAPFDLHVYRGKVAAVAEFCEGAGGAHGIDRDAADLYRLLLKSIDLKEPRKRPQLRVVSSTDDSAGPILKKQSVPGTASPPGHPLRAVTEPTQ